MPVVNVTGEKLNKVITLFSFTDYFGYNTEFKGINETEIKFSLINLNVEIIDSNEFIESYYQKINLKMIL